MRQQIETILAACKNNKGGAHANIYSKRIQLDFDWEFRSLFILVYIYVGIIVYISRFIIFFICMYVYLCIFL